MIRNVLFVLAALVGLVGCAADPVWAPDDVVQRAAYRHPGPPKLTLFTMISNTNGSGAHTSMMINASQRVIFDPSGSFHHPTIPERNDVLFGVTPQVADVYTRYHARNTYHVVVQELVVPAETAEKAMRLALANGAVMNAYCAHSTSGIISQLPGMTHIKQGMYPKKLAEQFGKLPGVKTRRLYEYDDDDNSRVLKEWDPTKLRKN
ncbi:MAG: hypothetical protein CSA70_10350 [Rhodobacterales bacterium]|nr:MAG: hypothetical protein CSA70_10350 [Rhodobacterales bacterium]